MAKRSRSFFYAEESRLSRLYDPDHEDESSSVGKDEEFMGLQQEVQQQD